MNDYVERLKRIVQEKAAGRYTVFAKNAGIAASTFQNYMNGRLPHPEHLIRINGIYNINMNWLLTGEGEMYVGVQDVPDQDAPPARPHEPSHGPLDIEQGISIRQALEICFNPCFNG